MTVLDKYEFQWERFLSFQEYKFQEVSNKMKPNFSDFFIQQNDLLFCDTSWRPFRKYCGTKQTLDFILLWQLLRQSVTFSSQNLYHYQKLVALWSESYSIIALFLLKTFLRNHWFFVGACSTPKHKSSTWH